MDRGTWQERRGAWIDLFSDNESKPSSFASEGGGGWSSLCVYRRCPIRNYAQRNTGLAIPTSHSKADTSYSAHCNCELSSCPRPGSERYNRATVHRPPWSFLYTLVLELLSASRVLFIEGWTDWTGCLVPVYSNLTQITLFISGFLRDAQKASRVLTTA